MPSIKVTKNKTTNKKVERINEILRSDSMLAKLEDKAKNNIQMMLLGNSKSVQEMKKQQDQEFDFKHKNDIQEYKHLFGGFETLCQLNQNFEKNHSPRESEVNQS